MHEHLKNRKNSVDDYGKMQQCQLKHLLLSYSSGDNYARTLSVYGYNSVSGTIYALLPEKSPNFAYQNLVQNHAYADAPLPSSR